MGVSVIIPTYNGEGLLRRNLPSLRVALDGYDGPWEVIVVEDGGADGTGKLIKDEYPEFSLLQLEENKGFGEACNEGVRRARYDVVYLLNNDVEVSGGFLDPLMGHFMDPDTFAAGSVEAVGGGYYAPRLRFGAGTFLYNYVMEEEASGPVEVFFVSAGHSAYDKSRFLELGGFDPLYRPYYWEDADICYRAWKMGWVSLYEPKSVVVHRHGSTIGRHDAGYVQKTHWRNRFLFTWKNLGAAALWARHLLYLPFLIILMPLFGKAAYTRGFFSALPRIPEINRKRGRLKDGDILPRFK
jgi:GT2 family glycosyltransferase